MKDFNFNLPIQIRWNDLDPLGHVNNALYITYFEVARGYFMVTACPEWNWQKDMFLIGNVNIDYRKELLLLDKQPKVWIKTSKLGNKSFVLDYMITTEKNGETIIHATGSTTQVMFDTKTRTTIEIPQWVRESLSKFDNLQ